jgi:hypothetical protein
VSEELKKLSAAQIALRVAFACGVTALVGITVFYLILQLFGNH